MHFFKQRNQTSFLQERHILDKILTYPLVGKNKQTQHYSHQDFPTGFLSASIPFCPIQTLSLLLLFLD